MRGKYGDCMCKLWLVKDWGAQTFSMFSFWVFILSHDPWWPRLPANEWTCCGEVCGGAGLLCYVDSVATIHKTDVWKYPLWQYWVSTKWTTTIETAGSCRSKNWDQETEAGSNTPRMSDYIARSKNLPFLYHMRMHFFLLLAVNETSIYFLFTIVKYFLDSKTDAYEKERVISR